MVRLRLRRVGLRNQPSYRIIAADKEKSRDGRFLEIIGFYNPRTEPSTIDLKEDRIFSWLSQGAQPSDSVAQIFKQVGLMDRFEKFKAGESVESLAEEAKNAAGLRVVSPKTNKVQIKKEPSKKKETPTVKVPLKSEETSKVEDSPKEEESPKAEEALKVEEAPKAEVTPEEEEAPKEEE
jgi:small subunit ribosomal protein S16